jgi:hypothetical protein
MVAWVRSRQRFVTDAWTVALLVSTALHAGFQLTVTAFRAGPTHRRLDSGLDPVLIGRLLTCDRWRTAPAVLALAGAVLLAIG